MKPGYKQTEAGVIPEEWMVRPLGELASVSAGGTPSRTHAEYWDGDIPWITTSEVDFCTINHAEQFITRAGLDSSAAKLLPPGTLLMALYGQGKTRGKVGALGVEAATNQACAAISVYPTTCREFVFHYLVSQYENIRKLSNTGNQENLNGSLVRSIPISCPPIAEQRTIAGALTDADALIASLEQLVAKKRHIKQGAMQELLTSEKRLPAFTRMWGKRRLGDVARLSKDGSNPAASPDTLFTHFSLPAFDSGSGPVIEEGRSIGSNKFIVPQNAVLLSKLNPRIPRVWAPASIPPNSVCSTEFLVLVPQASTNRAFLWAMCASQLVCRQMEQHAIGTTGSHQRINPTQALAIEVSWTDEPEEQAAIAEVLADMDAELAALETKLTKARHLKQGMMQELLTGRIRLA